MAAKAPRLKPKDKTFLAEVLKGTPQHEAAAIAGSKAENLYQAGHKLAKKIGETQGGSAALERAGLGLDAIIEKYLKPALDNKDARISLRALDMCLAMHGAYKAEQENISGEIRTILIPMRARPDRSKPANVPRLMPPPLDALDRQDNDDGRERDN